MYAKKKLLRFSESFLFL